MPAPSAAGLGPPCRRGGRPCRSRHPRRKARSPSIASASVVQCSELAWCRPPAASVGGAGGGAESGLCAYVLIVERLTLGLGRDAGVELGGYVGHEESERHRDQRGMVVGEDRRWI